MGFSLLELMLVFAILLVILAIALPGLTQPAKAANEEAAIWYMKTWSEAQQMYFDRHGNYASSETELVSERLIPEEKALAYAFRLDNPPGSTDRWWGSGNPADPNVTGDRYFFISIDGVLRYSLDGPAGLTSAPISLALKLTAIEDED